MPATHALQALLNAEVSNGQTAHRDPFSRVGHGVADGLEQRVDSSMGAGAMRVSSAAQIFRHQDTLAPGKQIERHDLIESPAPRPRSSVPHPAIWQGLKHG